MLNSLLLALYEGNPTMTIIFTPQHASNAEYVPCHDVIMILPGGNIWQIVDIIFADESADI